MTAAAAVAKARHDVLSHFMKAKAISKQNAVEYRPGRLLRGRQFARLRASGVIKDARGERYWSRTRRRRLAVVTGAATLLAAVIARRPDAFIHLGMQRFP